MNPALRRYTLSCAALMFLYSALVALISWGLDLQKLPYVLRVLAAASPALPLLAMLYVFDRYLCSEPDEFLRFLLSRAAMLAGGVVVGLFSAWGFLEQYAAWPRFPVILAFPLFWAVYGVAVVLLRRRFA
ncbi:hypothetical protein N7414_00360 [Pseudomonas sp. GD04087]|uniref:hypothetical protein n=1 Tax=unclassified Pseudomonas TaxID=196821 RepID=UPI00244B3281|nr:MULTISPECIES: hypothetical protein [unclassified Pseudomonas]MDH0287547.1 hypothetical protein [Pseudomonas sp. GD04087]MDH1047771.1 hypothetical protein [Pseudomonas sp. GD03903]MDH2001108.1 hypothetical protein [Pseudomonas sp. GD03691]